MTTDIYTKIIMTVIALLLSVLCVQNTIRPAFASITNSGSVQKVVICGLNGISCAEISGNALIVQN